MRKPNIDEARMGEVDASAAAVLSACLHFGQEDPVISLLEVSFRGPGWQEHFGDAARPRLALLPRRAAAQWPG